MFRNIGVFELWGWLFFSIFLLFVAYFVIKLFVFPGKESQIDPDRILIIDGQKYKFVKVEDDKDVASRI